jgi:hypothetical protein
VMPAGVPSGPAAVVISVIGQTSPQDKVITLAAQ